jgi:hypothetical protein
MLWKHFISNDHLLLDWILLISLHFWQVHHVTSLLDVDACLLISKMALAHGLVSPFVHSVTPSSAMMKRVTYT